MSGRHKVIIRRCEHYDPSMIRRIIREGLADFGLSPSGRVMLKPNVVIAQREVFPHAFTRSEFLDGALGAVADRSVAADEIAVGERSGITISTRYNFRQAGYPKVIRKHKAKTHYFDETPQVPVRLKRQGRLRDLIYVPRPVVECDFLINLPKFKAHPWSRMTLSLKNYIGIQDDRHRLVDHNSYLEHKIVDLQEVIQPEFIAVDGIVAGQKTMLTPEPFNLGAIVMGVNPCAVDAVCCHMVHCDPRDVVHLRMAAERGIGPIDLDQIDIEGDFPLAEVQAKTTRFQFLMARIDTYFKPESHLTCTVGAFPEPHSPDYCWGGCPGALQEAMHIFKAYAPDVEQTMQKVRYVVGRVEGPLQLEPDERVIFAGDCTSWEGEIDGKHVRIEPRYRTKEQVDACRTKSNDMLLGLAKTAWRLFRSRNRRWVHIPGCTVSVADHVNALSFAGKIQNPLFDRRMVFGVNRAYYEAHLHRIVNCLKP
jgi:uncharacterized protein (DUF362 family)